MMTPGAYLELVGLPQTGKQRREVLDSPFGLNGLVLRSVDAQISHERLRVAGFEPLAPVTFSRPVEIDGREEEARFRTVRLPAKAFAAGRVYFCEHLTPQYVWRQEWLTHPNGFCGIDRILVESEDPDDEAGRYAMLLEGQAQLSNGSWHVRSFEFSLEVKKGAKPRFQSVGLVFQDLEEIETRALALPEAKWERLAPNAATLTIPAFDLSIACRSFK
jgi:hypothetical protein